MDKLKQFYNDNKDAIIKPIAVITCICIIVTLALSVTNLVTQNRIAALSEAEQKEAMTRVIKAEEYTEHTAAFDDETVYYRAVSGGETVGYIFTVTEKGYGGDVTVMTGINTDGTVAAVDILDASNETPGLGQNVTKEGFYSQFAGKSAGISVLKNGAVSENNEVDAVTGATISSRAVTNAVNSALESYNLIAGGEEVEE